ELFDQCALPGGELGRHLDLDVHQVVAARRRLARGLRDAAAADPEHPARLRALRDAHLDGAVERGDLEHGAQRRLREADRVLAASGEAVAAGHAVLGDAQADVEIARTGPALAGFAFALERLDGAVLKASDGHDGELARLAVAGRDLDRLARAERGLLEGQLERVAHLVAALLAPAAAKHVVEDVLSDLDDG